MSKTVAIHVVSHDPDLLKALPTAPEINRHLLSDLEIPPKFQGEMLAENRFLLTNLLIDKDADYVVFASARWDERFPRWPKIQDIKSALNDGSFPESSFFAPLSIRVSGAQAISWIKAQDKVHPGISKIMIDVFREFGLSIDETRLTTVVMGNNFILSRKDAESFLAFWKTAFAYLVEKHDLNPPFSYRCPKCGLESDDQIGRWSRDRHMGFLLERVSSLYFIANPGLRPFDLSKGRPVRRRLISFLFTIGPMIFKPIHSLFRFGRACSHSHHPVGS